MASALILALLVGAITVGLRKSPLIDNQKRSPFECGFSGGIRARLPLSLRFFLVAVIFLIFDVELVLLFPFMVRFSLKSLSVAFLSLVGFLLALGLGLYYEWSQGMLDWANFS